MSRVKYIAIVHRVTGVVDTVQLAPGGNLPEEGIVPGSDQLKVRYHIPETGWENINETQLFTEYYRKDNAWVHRGAPTNKYYEWSTDTEAWVFNKPQFLKEVRLERDKRLFESDWTQVPDSPLEVSVREDWKAYRQLLRDIPATVESEVTSLDHLGWPATPTGESVEITTW